MTERQQITREQIALALCCPDPDIRCKADTCGCQQEYRDQVNAIAQLLDLDGESGSPTEVK